MKFRTDLPLMGDKEVKGWIENIIENTNVIDIQMLYEYIGNELENRNMNMVIDRTNKICDICNTTYPEHYDKCLYTREAKIKGKIINCQDKPLRSFKIHDNRKEIYKLIRPN